MNDTPFDDDLLSLWQTQGEDLTIINNKELMMSLQTEYRTEQRNLFWLNFREGIAALGLAIGLGWAGLTATTGGWAILSAAVITLGVGVFLTVSTVRQRKAESQFGSDLRGELERSRSQVSHRAQMYRSVGWWYMTPMTIATLLLVVAFREAWTPLPLAIFGVGLAVGSVLLYRLNRRIGQTRYEPRVKELTQLIRDLDPV